jgi:class 3 adenylate cyclase
MASEISVTLEQPDASTAVDGERKTVTALFADIKGSMELIEDLDPEEARRLVDPALKLMMNAVHRYEGYVAQSTRGTSNGPTAERSFSTRSQRCGTVRRPSSCA